MPCACSSRRSSARSPRPPASSCDRSRPTVAPRYATGLSSPCTWTPPAAIEAPTEPTFAPTFHEFAEEWWTLTAGQLAANTQADYRWRLEGHLIPWFGERALDAITFDTVERYIAGKLAEDEPLSARSVNMTVTLLGATLSAHWSAG
jgi:Phage integrase, N-terminal SAM-like domain